MQCGQSVTTMRSFSCPAGIGDPGATTVAPGVSDTTVGLKTSPYCAYAVGGRSKSNCSWPIELNTAMRWFDESAITSWCAASTAVPFGAFNFSPLYPPLNVPKPGNEE